jgi:anaerobic selenocysteine-containing dehydrogenase
MEPDERSVKRVRGYCALCVSRCGSLAVVDGGRFVRLEPDPAHPTGKALCAKGRAAPELVEHRERLRHPLRRTRPKGSADPGWQAISWDQALELAAGRLHTIAERHGPESVAFSVVSPSTSASDDANVWIQRLMNAFGTPNAVTSMELCGWGRFLATQYTFGAGVPGHYMPDLEQAGCILYWGYNPNLARLAHATATVEAQKRGARLIVVDPRRTVPARRADVWLQVRPGTDAALALGLTHVMIERGWYDRAFVHDWTNAPLLVREENGRLLTERDLLGRGSERGNVAWDEDRGRPVVCAPGPQVAGGGPRLALTGSYTIDTVQGPVACRPVFELVSAACRRYRPERVAEITGVEPREIELAARLLWEARPVAYYAWSGVEMQTGATQIARAIAQLYALTGSIDAPGGNVRFAVAPTADVSGAELLPAEQRAKTLGLADRPLGPARFGHVTSGDLYDAILDRRPYAVHGLVGFGANLLLSHADSDRGRAALRALDFYVHCDLFMNPTAEQADLVLPVASPFEREALKVGFEVNADAQAWVQLRGRVVEPRGEARGDTEIVFALAEKLRLGHHFWNGDIQAAYRHMLEPSGVSLEALREQPGGVRAPVETRYEKYRELLDGMPRGFPTPTGRVELYSQILLDEGYPPLPEYAEPGMSPVARPELAARYPLVLTCSKPTLFCESQHRALPSLRRLALEPELELHPATAAERGIRAGDWVRLETPEGSVLARARLDASLNPAVVSAQHGWWQACEEIGAPAYDPFGPAGANLNRIIGRREVDPVSGAVPHRAYLCQVERA